MENSDFKKVADGLVTRGIVSHWDEKPHRKTNMERADDLTPLTSPVCQGCGGILGRTGRLPVLPRYCEDCMACNNNEEDYEQVRKIVWDNMRNYVRLSGNYSLRLRWLRLKYGGKPVKVKGGTIRKAYLLARCPVRRDALDVHMVFAYLTLWLQEYGDEGPNREKAARYLDEKLDGLAIPRWKALKILKFWYVLMYLYQKNRVEDAERFRRIVSRDEKVKAGLYRMIEENKCYPYPKEGLADQAYLNRILAQHPIAEMGTL